MTTTIKKQMEENNKKDVKLTIIYILLLVISIAIVVLARFLYAIGDLACFRLLTMVIFGQILVIFSTRSSSYYKDFFDNNRTSVVPFYLFYMLFMIISVVLPYIPVEVWPIVVIFVLLAILSNLPTGIISASICLVIAFSLGGAGYFSYFSFYFLCGMISVLLFSRLDEEFKIGFPLMIIELVLLCGLTIIIITSSNALQVETFIYPIANGIATLLLILIILKAYSNRVVYAQKDMYMDLNNPECQLLSELKNCSPDDYHKTVHVVYFCDRLARRLNLDEDVVKCAGLYHRVGIIGGANNWENTSLICTEQNLPAEVMQILQEYLDKKTGLLSAESAVLYMSECIVSSLVYLFSKNKDITLDYPSLVEAIFKQRIETGLFNNCNISIAQFETMKKVFLEEKLYYDFLR